MTKKIRWGILGAANIAVKKVIPAMQKGEYGDVVAIASRNADKAREAAETLGVPKFYASYESLLADPEIDAVYNPLPNNLHVEWSIRAAEAGKHVLCEKPVAMNAAEVEKLIAAARRTGAKIEEAFMVRTHPQWTTARDLIRAGRIGDVQAVTGFFSYFNADAGNIRNRTETGGGALYDIGCYCINTARFMLGEEPRRVASCIVRDPATGIDKLTSAILDLAGVHVSFTCATQLVPHQRMQFFGSRGRLEIEIPFNIPPDTPTRVLIDDGRDLYGRGIETIEIPAVDQYTIQGDLFARAIIENKPPAVALEDSLKNMVIIDAVFRAAESGVWETV